jgi:hypothetical protein
MRSINVRHSDYWGKIMKMVYTHENRFFVHNAKNIIDTAGISTLLKNEYAAGAAGDIAPFDAWLELWVLDDSDYGQAFELIEQAFDNHSQDSWGCSHCKSKNEPAFEICRACQTESQQ